MGKSLITSEVKSRRNKPIFLGWILEYSKGIFSFFIGVLGRKRGCALHKGEVEIPSDFSGVLWIRMDSEGGWQLKLARELMAAGFEVDLNKIM